MKTPHSSRPLNSVLVALLGAVLAACNTAPTRDPDFAAVRPPQAPAPAPRDGALYQAGFDMSLFEDIRARRVGDILNVVLVENTDAEKSADTTVTKDTTTTITNPTLLGSAVQFNTPNILPLASNTNNSLQTSLSSSNDFEGSGESNQSNSLTGNITVSVAEVLPNGDLVVQGEKLISLTEGYEHLRLSGTVRQADITPQNTVLSTQVGNARIEYAGQDGATASANVLGWMARFFISAFFPF